ncbi:MAG: hypothetical protein AAF511_02890, partial [Pseudomonadota bacterium]
DASAAALIETIVSFIENSFLMAADHVPGHLAGKQPQLAMTKYRVSVTKCIERSKRLTCDALIAWLGGPMTV